MKRPNQSFDFREMNWFRNELKWFKSWIAGHHTQTQRQAECEVGINTRDTLAHMFTEGRDFDRPVSDRSWFRRRHQQRWYERFACWIVRRACLARSLYWAPHAGCPAPASLAHPQTHIRLTGWPQRRRKKFLQFSRAIIIVFQRLPQQQFWRFGSIYGNF